MLTVGVFKYLKVGEKENIESKKRQLFLRLKTKECLTEQVI